MDTHNIATVITPNILRHIDINNKGPGMDESFLAIEAVYMLIEYNDQMCEVSTFGPLSQYISKAFQVPEDIQSILNDSSLFNNSSDITTKEILKRYGDVVRSPAGQPLIITDNEFADSPLPRKESTGNSRAGAPVVTRVDKDPHQARAWQKESSVRHVQSNGGLGHATGPNQNTPPQVHFEFANATDSSHRRTGSNESTGNSGTSARNGNQRQFGWGKQAASGPMGVTGVS